MDELIQVKKALSKRITSILENPIHPDRAMLPGFIETLITLDRYIKLH